MLNDNDFNHSGNDSSNESDTIPDEDFNNQAKPKNKQISCPNIDHKIGPNINFQFYKKRYSNEEERAFFFDKIGKKQKTELCKNFDLFHDCFYKNKCSFAHGVQELRQDAASLSYKTKICKTFQEEFYCKFGQRCSYRHIIKEKRLFTYSFLLKRMCDDLLTELNKQGNSDNSMVFLYKRQLSKRSLITPRLEVLNSLAFS